MTGSSPMTPAIRPALILGAWLAASAATADEPGRSFPACSAVIDVTRPPYNAKGDGAADDTDAIQRALSDMMGQHKVLYFPRGTYLVSRTLNWSKKNSAGQDAWGFNALQGQDNQRTSIRLKDGTFTDPASPRAIMWCGGFGSADWFHNYIDGLTFDVGRGNPGAVGLQFYSNNMGTLRDVRIVSGDGAGVTGLDLGHRDMNGPLLVRGLTVRGFAVGVRTGNVVNSQTFERVDLAGQAECGFVNGGQSVAIRGLRSENAVPALRADGPTALLDADLKGIGAAKGGPAIRVGKVPFFARDVRTAGYASAIAVEEGRGADGPAVEEFVAGRPDAPRSPRLPVKETPDVPWTDPATWAVVDAFGADPNGQMDASDAIQRAIDSGAETVFLPGHYRLSKPVRLRGAVRRLLGVGDWIDYAGESHPDLIVEDGASPVVVVEHIQSLNGGIEVDTERAVVFRSLEARIALKRAGDVFLEDVATHDLRVGPGQRVWARQLDIENEGTHLTNRGGTLWVLGYKTERGGTLLHTAEGGRSELFGTFSYTTTAGKLAPMFATEGDSSVFAFFHEVCFTGDPFATLIRETRGGATRTVRRGEGSIAPYASRPR